MDELQHVWTLFATILLARNVHMFKNITPPIHLDSTRVTDLVPFSLGHGVLVPSLILF